MKCSLCNQQIPPYSRRFDVNNQENDPRSGSTTYDEYDAPYNPIEWELYNFLRHRSRIKDPSDTLLRVETVDKPCHTCPGYHQQIEYHAFNGRVYSAVVSYGVCDFFSLISSVENVVDVSDSVPELVHAISSPESSPSPPPNDNSPIYFLDLES